MMDTGSNGGSDGLLWWAASSCQLTAGIAFYRMGGISNRLMMPFNAFFIATLFVGGGACAGAGALHSSGIHTVDDVKEMGKRLRRWIQEVSPPSPRDAN